MATYEDARAKTLVNATTVTITALPLEGADDHSLRRAGYIPFTLCLCVTEPCDCQDEIVWVPEAAIRADVASGRRTKDADELHEYAVDVDAPVVLESVRSAKARDITRGHRSAGRRSAPFLVRRRTREAAGARSAQPGRPCGEQALARDASGCTDYEITENGEIYRLIYGDADVCIYVGEITIS
jgi:hypothetical protein